jgi:geranylgeranyl pyrophosphate synthase
LSTVTFTTPVQEQIKLVEERIRAQADDNHPDLRAALEHLLSSGGKRVRPTVVLLIGNMLGGAEEKLVTVGAAIELLHTATLVHDDLIDGSLLRRGMPTLNARWSPAATVLTGDFLFARAAKLAAEADHLPLMKLFAGTLATIVNGELTQLFTSRGLINRGNYYQRIYAKTASLFEMSALAGALVSPVDEDTVESMRVSVTKPGWLSRSWTTFLISPATRQRWASRSAPTCCRGWSLCPRSITPKPIPMTRM